MLALDRKKMRLHGGGLGLGWESLPISIKTRLTKWWRKSTRTFTPATTHTLAYGWPWSRLGITSRRRKHVRHGCNSQRSGLPQAHPKMWSASEYLAFLLERKENNNVTSQRCWNEKREGHAAVCEVHVGPHGIADGDSSDMDKSGGWTLRYFVSEKLSG